MDQEPLETRQGLPPSNSPDSHAIQAQLTRIQNSTGFATKERLKKFLTFVVQQHLDGKADQLTEFSIAEDVFEIKDFDPRNDAIVRATVRRLRQELSTYYETLGQDDLVLVELPKGYVPKFTLRIATPEIVLEPAQSPEVVHSEGSSGNPESAAVVAGDVIASRRLRWLLPALVVSAVCAVIVWGLRTPQPSPRAVRLGRLFARSTQEGGRFERITVGKAPWYVAITPDGGELYASNHDDGTVSVIRQRSRTVTHTLRVASQPAPLAVSPDGQKVYVGSRVSGVSIIDVGTKAVTAIATDGPIQTLVITPDGTRLFMAMTYKGLKRLSVATGKIESIPVVGCPYGLAIDPAGKRLYVSYRCGGPGGKSGWDAVDVMDLEREVSVGTVNGLPLVGGPIAVSSDNSQVWVGGSDRCFSTNYDHTDCPKGPGGLVQVIRAFDLKHLAAVSLPLTQSYPSFYPDGSRAILVGSELAEVRDTANFRVLENLENTTLRGSVAFSPDGRSAYVAELSPDGVRVLEPEPVDCEPLRFGLYHLWAMDGNVNDIEGPSSGKATGGSRFAPGRRGQALSLDGTGVVELSPHQGVLNWHEAWSRLDWTLAAWLKPSSTDTDTVVIGGSRQDYSWSLGHSRTGNWQYQIGSFTVASKALAEPGRWDHIAVVHSSGLLSLYVNGIKQNNITLGRFAPSPGVSATIGADPRGGRFFKGLIDEVRIHQAALPEATLQSLARGDRAVCEEKASH